MSPPAPQIDSATTEYKYSGASLIPDAINSDASLSGQYFTKFQDFLIDNVGEEVNTSYFTPSTPFGSPITQREIIGSSRPDNMHIYKL
jgi:hypothetical protein